MSYGKDPVKRSNVFEIEHEDLTELVRQAFCLTHRRHDYYLRELEKTVMMDDPAKVVILARTFSVYIGNTFIMLFICINLILVGPGERNERTSVDL